MLTPVVWNASVAARFTDGNTGGSDPVIHPDYRFFTLDNLDDYLSLKFEANHGRYGILFDSLRARYQDETKNIPVDLVVGSELGFIEISGRYQLYNNLKLDIIAGLRRSFLDIDGTFTPPFPLATVTIKHEFSWTDPLIGLRYQHPLSEKWHAYVRGDIGGFNVSTQRMINFTADMQYLINNHVSFSIGYRYLEIDFKEDDVLYDVSLSGLQLGIGIHF